MSAIYIIGVGGRTGTMLARELRGAAKIIGVGQMPEIKRIAAKKIKIIRGGNKPEEFVADMIMPENFAAAIVQNVPDFLWLATRNPVDKIIAFYYRHFLGKETFPALILSQNGRSAIADAKKGLRDALGQEWDKVEIIRVSLINGVDLVDIDGTSVINYKLPIKLGFGVVKFAGVLFAQNRTGATLPILGEIFRKAKIESREFRSEEVLAMENAKLFLNLIGMAAAVEGIDAAAGWREKKIFEKEIAMLKEFVVAAKKRGGGFVGDLGGYPVKFLAQLVLSPVWLLAPFGGIFARIISRGRNRVKDLSEIDYYNGEVVKLGKKAGVATAVNEEIIAKAKALKCKI